MLDFVGSVKILYPKFHHNNQFLHTIQKIFDFNVFLCRINRLRYLPETDGRFDRKSRQVVAAGRTDPLPVLGTAERWTRTAAAVFFEHFLHPALSDFRFIRTLLARTMIPVVISRPPINSQR